MTDNNSVRGIFFDLGWTLFHPKYPEWFINDKIIEYVGMESFGSLPKHRKDSAFEKALKYLDDNHSLTTEEEELEQFLVFYSTISDNLPELGLTRAAIEEIAYTKVFDTSNYIFYDDVKPALTKLKQSYKLGVLSNTWPSAGRILRSGGIDALFDVKIYSCEVGASKPDAKIYEAALEQMGLPAGQTVFVDDSEPNLAAAAEHGMLPVLKAARPNLPGSGRFPAIGCISDLFALLQE